MEKPKNVNPTMERRASSPVDFDAGCPHSELFAKRGIPKLSA
jgi:hypothetical protein